MFLMDEQSIGLNIRRLRELRGLTLTYVANAAELAKSTISKIENGQISSPISTLMRLADALGVRLAEFFIDPSEQPPYVLTRKGAGPVIAQNGSQFGYSYQSLAMNMPNKQAEPFLLTINPGDPVGEFRHDGQEFIYMLTGRMRFTVGDEVLVLRQGDALYFDPTKVHKTEVVGGKPAKFLCVFIQGVQRNND